jgi:transcriptional regulator with XRE-family HTH domain
MNSIGERLKQERERLGKNQEEFGAAGGVARNAQGRYEKDQRSPDALYLESVSRIGADVLYIVTGTRSGASTRVMTPDEMTLLDLYRRCDQSGRLHLSAAARAFVKLDVEYESISAEGTLRVADDK